MDGICIFHPYEKHKTQECNMLQGFADEILKSAQKADQEKKANNQKDDFLETHKEVNYIFGGPDCYKSKRNQKLTAQEVMAVSPTTPECLNWSEVPITFDRSNHLDFIPKQGRYPLIVSLMVKGVKLNRVFIDARSLLNILSLKAFDQMGLPRLVLRLCKAPLHGFIPGTSASPVGQITLPVTFGTHENYCTEHMQFEVADFQMVYNAFLGRPALTKFMATWS
jgi:hypothetical protein